MSDRRTLLSNGRVAHTSLRGQVEVPRFVDGTLRRVRLTTTALLDAPGGARDREMLLGERFLALEDHDDHVFGQRVCDGYAGYLAADALADDGPTPTHRVTAIRSYAKPTPQLKHFEPVTNLSLGTQLTVTGTTGDWAEVTLPGADRPHYLPAQHIAPLNEHASDPVGVARLFIGTPYLWGGNSAFGIDCSGLVQTALHACGIACPGDSDQQTCLGAAVTGDPMPGDLLFWKGHVALVATPRTLLHATAFCMSVVEEPLAPALARITASDAGPPTHHQRLT